MKKFIKSALIVVVSVSVFGCGSANNAPAQNSDDLSGNVPAPANPVVAAVADGLLPSNTQTTSIPVPATPPVPAPVLTAPFKGSFKRIIADVTCNRGSTRSNYTSFTYDFAANVIIVTYSTGMIVTKPVTFSYPSSNQLVVTAGPESGATAATCAEPAGGILCKSLTVPTQFGGFSQTINFTITSATQLSFTALDPVAPITTGDIVCKDTRGSGSVSVLTLL